MPGPKGARRYSDGFLTELQGIGPCSGADSLLVQVPPQTVAHLPKIGLWYNSDAHGRADTQTQC